MAQENNRPQEARNTNGAREMPAQRARQGVELGRVRYVLATSLFLVVVAFLILYLSHT